MLVSRMTFGLQRLSMIHVKELVVCSWPLLLENKCAFDGADASVLLAWG